jgi:hypothetical protein
MDEEILSRGSKARDAEEETDKRSGFAPSRREVLAGAGSLLVAERLAIAEPARSPHYVLTFDDDALRDVVSLIEMPSETEPAESSPPPGTTAGRVQKGGTIIFSWRRSSFGPDASFAALQYKNKQLPPTDKSGRQRLQPLSWTLTIRNATFPGSKPCQMDVTLWREKIDDDWHFKFSTTSWWDNGAKVASDHVPAKAFLAPPGSGQKDLALPIQTAARSTALLKSFFGERIEAGGDITVSLDKNLVWHVAAKAPESSPLYILDVPLTFGKVKVRRISSESPKSGKSTNTEQTATPATPPMPPAAAGHAPGQSIPAQSPPGEAPRVCVGGPADNKDLLFDAEAAHAPPPRKGADVGLYGDISAIQSFPLWELPVTARKPPTAGALFNFATTTVKDDSIAIRFQLDEPFTRDLKTRLRAGLRHWGDPAYTVAGCVSEKCTDYSVGEINVVTQRKSDLLIEGPFEFAGFELVRQLRKSNQVVTRLRLDPSAKEHALETRFGSLIISDFARRSSAPGQEPRTPPIEVEAYDRPNGLRTLSRFDARLQLHQAGVHLPERIQQKPPLQPGAKSPTHHAHTTRLGFRRTGLQLHIPALGRLAKASASAVIPLGPVLQEKISAEFDLSDADLTIRRPIDLLALKFRFSGLILTVPWSGSDGETATLAPRGAPASCLPRPVSDGPGAATRDDRPMLVVDFPPQHVAERAYFRQYPLPPDLPSLVLDQGEAPAQLAILRKPKSWRGRQGANYTTRDERIEARKKLRKLTEDTRKDFYKEYFARFETETARAGLPREQRTYAGEEFLDPDARRVAIRILEEYQAEAQKNLPPAQTAADAIRRAPEVDLDPAVRNDILAQSLPKEQGKLKEKLPEKGEAWPKTADVYSLGKKKEYEDAITALEEAKERRDGTYALFRREYARQLAAIKPDGPWTAPSPEIFDRPELYRGRVWYGFFRDKLHEKTREFVENYESILSKADAEKFEAVTEARLSGPSRIAFRLNCDDYESGRVGGRIPFSLEGLTNWASMDMAVVRRAERLMQRDEMDILPPRWQRKENLDEGDILRFQGLSAGPPEKKPGDQVCDPSELQRRVTPVRRLAEVYENAKDRPDLFQTALELPFRLFLSPAQDATWKTPSSEVQREFASTLASHPPPAGKAEARHEEQIATFRELWTARLLGNDTKAGVRAVWSPDFRPAALLSTSRPGAPPRGPWAPWAIRPTDGIRTGSGGIGNSELPRFRTSLDAYDRHELVILSSVHGLPVLGRRTLQRDLAREGSQIEPPDGFRLDGLACEEPTKGELLNLSAIYKPRPLSVTELSLSALGGSLDLDTIFVPPASAKDQLGKNLFDAFSVERWRQRTVLGRDVVVEVVYKGFLFPIGHRASLVKLTERRFVAMTQGGPPVATLIQRMFLRVGEPVKDFPAYAHPNKARRWPTSKVTILTRRTPDIVDPTDDRSENVPDDNPVRLNGSIFLKNATGLVFWPRISRRGGSEVWFEMQIGEEATPLRLPLIFVDNTAVNDPDTIRELIKYYSRIENAENVSPSRRLNRLGQPVVMAPESKQGDTTLESEWWDLLAEGREKEASWQPITPATTGKPGNVNNTRYERDSFMEGLDQPPFYPFVDAALCRFTQVERFSGSDKKSAIVSFDGEYVVHGFGDEPDIVANSEPKNPSEIFLRVRQEYDKQNNPSIDMNMGNRGDLSGGVAQPNLKIVGYSRKLGPVGDSKGTVPEEIKAAPAPGAGEAPPPLALPSIPRDLSPNKFFPADAKLLGLLPLSTVLKFVEKIFAVDDHPRLKEIIDYGAELGDNARAILTDKVIRPALQLVERIARDWQDLANKQLKLADQALSLASAYPEIGKELDELRKLLRSATDVTTSDQAFFASLAQTYESGRRLILTIDRIARDPLAAISDAQLDTLRSLQRRVREFADNMRTLVDLRDLPALFFKRTIEASQDRANESSRKLRRMLLSLPLPPAVRNLNAALRLRFANIVDEAIAEAFMQLLCSIEAGNCVVSPAQLSAQTLLKLPEAIAKALRNAQTPPPALSPILEELAKDLEQAAQEDVKQAFDQIASPILRDLFDIATEISNDPDAAAALKKLEHPDIVQNPTDLFATLAKLAPYLFKVLTILGLAEHAKAVATAACDKLVDALKKAASAFLPTLDKIKDIKACAERLTADFKLPPGCLAGAPFSTSVVRALQFLSEVINDPSANALQGRLRTIREKIGEAANDVAVQFGAMENGIKVLDDAIGALPTGACAPPPPDLIVAIKRLDARQRAVLNSLKAFHRVISEEADKGGILDDLSALTSEAAPAIRKKLLDAIIEILSASTIATHAAQALTFLNDVQAGATAKIEELAAAVDGLADSIQPVLPTVGGALKNFATQIRGALIALKGDVDGLKAAEDKLKAVAKEIADAVNELPEAAKNAAIARAKAAIDEAVTKFDDVKKNVLDALQNVVLMNALRIAAVAEAELTGWLTAIATLLKEPIKTLNTFYEKTDAERQALITLVDGVQNEILKRLIDAITRKLGVQHILKIDFKKLDGTNADTEKLVYEHELVNKLANNWSGSITGAQAIDGFILLDELGRVWRSNPALLVLLLRLREIDSSVLKLVVIDALDLRGFRRELDKLIRELVPTKITLAYDLKSNLNDGDREGGAGKVFMPGPGTQVTLATRTEINLLSIAGGEPIAPKISVLGSIGPFAVNLLGSFEVVRLHFHGLTFGAGSGRSADFNIRFARVQIGEKAKFLEQLQSYLSPKGGGFYLNFMSDRPGLEAGYGINLGCFGVGTLSFSNVTLNAGARLPFDNSDAEFVVSIGRADAPFLISSTIFGGGGYLAIISSAKGFKGLEASFNFGGVFTFGFGPLQGTGQITLGTYFRKAGAETTIGVIFNARGAASIACFGFSTSLYIRLTQQGGQMQGEATYTFSFSLGIDDIEFRVQVQNNQGSNMGTKDQAGNSAALPPGLFGPETEFAQADELLLFDEFSAARKRPGRSEPGRQPARPEPSSHTGPALRVEAIAQVKDWLGYRNYFDNGITPPVLF